MSTLGLGIPIAELNTHTLLHIVMKSTIHNGNYSDICFMKIESIKRGTLKFM